MIADRGFSGHATARNMTENRWSEAEDDRSEQIARIEARLEELADAAERCRKIILVSKLVIYSGAGLLLGAVLGLVGSNAVTALGAIAAVLGGIVSLGSNVSTLQQTMAAMAAAETFRSDLIGSIDLRLVGDGR
jgi:hypothetical protein